MADDSKGRLFGTPSEDEASAPEAPSAPPAEESGEGTVKVTIPSNVEAFVSGVPIKSGEVPRTVADSLRGVEGIEVSD